MKFKKLVCIFLSYVFQFNLATTVRKVSKYGVFCGPYFPAFGTEKIPYLDTFHAVYG